MKYFYQIFLIHIFWVSLHFMSAHLYTKYCTPWSIFGVAISSLVTMTPHCEALRWCIMEGASAINSIWITLGTWFLAKATTYKILRIRSIE